MKICAFIAGLFLLAGCAHTTTSSGPIDIDGTWRGKTGGGGMGGPPMEITYNFKRDGDILRGTVSGPPQNPWLPIVDGKIDGNKISFTLIVPWQGSNMTFEYKGKLKGNTIKMTYQTKMGGGFGMGGFGMGGFGGRFGGGFGGGSGGKINVKRVD